MVPLATSGAEAPLRRRVCQTVRTEMFVAVAKSAYKAEPEWSRGGLHVLGLRRIIPW